MSLTGNLEDLPLLDILQIVSFSKKTGYLSIRTPRRARAPSSSEDGFVVSAFSGETPPLDPRAAQLPPEGRGQLLRERIEIALEQLIRLREGQFSFSLTDEPPREVGAARHRARRRCATGINAQELLLDLARGMDEDRRDSTAALEASFAEPPDDDPVPAGAGGHWSRRRCRCRAAAACSARRSRCRRRAPDGRRPVRAAARRADGREANTILLVDDEDDVRRMLAERFAARRATRWSRPKIRTRPSRRPAALGKAGDPVPARHRPRHADLGRLVVPGRLRGGEAPLEDEPAPAGAAHDGGLDAHRCRRARGRWGSRTSSSSPASPSWIRSSSRPTCGRSRARS